MVLSITRKQLALAVLESERQAAHDAPDTGLTEVSLGYSADGKTVTIHASSMCKNLLTLNLAVVLSGDAFSEGTGFPAVVDTQDLQENFQRVCTAFMIKPDGDYVLTYELAD